MTDLAELTAATAHLDPPLVALDVTAMRANAADLVRRAGGKPVRVASKSVRCRAVLDLALATPGFAGVMGYSVREAIWLVRHGVRDVLLGYPSADRGALAELAGDPALTGAITLMVDGAEQLALTRAAAGDAALRVCLDVDASLRVGRLHLGVRRSPLRTPAAAAVLAQEAAAQGFRVVGVMFYEAQIAGLPDSSAAVRLVKRRSAAELARRRSAVVAAVQAAVGRLDIVNSGGTGSLEISSGDRAVTEGHRRFRALRSDAVRQLPSVPAAAGPVLRAAGRAPSGPTYRDAVRRWLRRVRAGGEVPRPQPGSARAAPDRRRGCRRGADPGARRAGRRAAGR